jgi:hypothetical protein
VTPSPLEPRPRSWRDRLGSALLREPLFAFFLIGMAVFGVDSALRGERRTIRVTPSVRHEVAQSLESRLGRPPESAELEAGVEQWKEEEALYREGLRTGQLEQDGVIRAHVAAKLLAIARERDVFAEPTEAELRDFLERHRKTYTFAPTFDFDQVFIAETRSDARAGAERVLSTLRAGASPEGLGDWFPRGHSFRQMTKSDVSTLFGAEAAREMPGYAAGDWNLVSGPRGFYALRLLHSDRGEPDFAKLRPSLALALEAEQRDNAARAYARLIMAHYRFTSSE